MRLIDADWMLEHRYKELISYDTYDLEEILECVPTVEQKHGHWIDSPFQSYHPMEENENGDLILHNYIGGICSNCGFKTGTHKPKYCEECGAETQAEDIIEKAIEHWNRRVNN